MKVGFGQASITPRGGKTVNKKLEAVSGAYWAVVTAVYLGYSFYTFEWHRSWVIWPVAAVAFCVMESLFAIFNKNEKDK